MRRHRTAILLLLAVILTAGSAAAAGDHSLAAAGDCPPPVAELLAMRADPVGSLFPALTASATDSEGGGSTGGRQYKESNPRGAAYMIAGVTTLAVGLVMESFVGYLLAGVGLGVGVYGAIIYF